MNSNYSLETTLRDVLQLVNPTVDDCTKRCHVMSDIRAIVESLEVFKGATVEPFGSFASNLFTRWGDLDISISYAGKKYHKNVLEEVTNALEKIGGFNEITYISHAKVPIVKCVSDKYKISCDISLNNLSSQMKARMLYWINEIDGRFRDLVLIVKEWAKAQSINDPKTGTLNSFSLTLLVIFHFQTCDPPLLPPLSEVYPGNMADDLTGVRAIAEKNIENICSSNIDKFKANMSRIPNTSSLSDLFISFLEKFSGISVRGQHRKISTKNAKWEEIGYPPKYALFIEDPFDQPENCARAVIPKNILVIDQAFQSTYKQLTSGKLQNPLSVLVSPKAESSSGILVMNHPNPNGMVKQHTPGKLQNPLSVLMSPKAESSSAIIGMNHPNQNGSNHHVIWKSLLNEDAQKRGKKYPVYTSKNEGCVHIPRFRSTVSYDCLNITSPNTFQKIKMAEEDVSRIAYITLQQTLKNDALEFIKEIPNKKKLCQR